MALMTKAEAKKFADMDDRMLDVLDYLKSKQVLDAKTHRSILLKGYKGLVAYLQEKKHIDANEAKQAIEGGFYYLLPRLAK
jgi:hypothetical protein